MAVSRTPKVNALVVSLNAGKDGATGRLDLLGIIGTMQVPEFPHELPGLAVFVSLTNLQGSYRLALEITDLEKDERLAGVEQDGQFRLSDPLKIWTEVARIPGPLVLEHPGRYACRLLLNREYLHEVVFELVQER
jgi:hypothetical protein